MLFLLAAKITSAVGPAGLAKGGGGGGGDRGHEALGKGRVGSGRGSGKITAGTQ